MDPLPPAPHRPPPRPTIVVRPTSLIELLKRQTPRVVVTPTLIALNAAVYVVMVLLGVDAMSPTVPELQRFGANVGALAGDGEAWRLLTCTFVHAGLLHVGINMWVLKSIGPFVERLVGNTGFLVAYLVSGLAGSLASSIWHPLATSVGASGAVFGVVGVLLGVLSRRPRGMPEEGRLALRRNMLTFVALNVFIGLAIPRIDMAGHVGGLVAGTLCGLALGGPSMLLERRGRGRRAAAVAAVGAVAIAVGAALLPGGRGELVRAMAAFGEADLHTVEVYNAAITRRRGREITDAALARVIEDDVLPTWTAVRARMEAVPDELDPLVPRMRAAAGHEVSAWEWTLASLRAESARAAKDAAGRAAEEHEKARAAYVDEG